MRTTFDPSTLLPILGDYTGYDIFPVCNLVVVPWFCLLVAPKNKLTDLVVNAFAVIACGLYTHSLVTVMLLGKRSEDEEGSEKSLATFEGVYDALSNPDITFPAWIHYGFADLMVGLSIVKEINKYNVSPAKRIGVITPVLLLTMMFCPIGFLVFVTLVRPGLETSGSKTN